MLGHPGGKRSETRGDGPDQPLSSSRTASAETIT
jgi:hypothetical protein